MKLKSSYTVYTTKMPPAQLKDIIRHLPSYNGWVPSVSDCPSYSAGSNDLNKPPMVRELEDALIERGEYGYTDRFVSKHNHS